MNYYRQYRPAGNSMFPPGILNLIIINGIMFLAKNLAVSSGVDLDAKFALYHPYSDNFHWYQYITSMFMHADLGHILFNMLALWMFGAMLENAIGLRRFLIYYFICGLGASLIYQGWETYAQVKHLSQYGDGWELIHTYFPLGSVRGASGAVYGVMLGAALLFPNTEMYYMGFMGIPIKMKWLAVIYGGGELIRAWQADPADNVAHFAHIGGMIFGFIMIRIFQRNRNTFY